VFSEGVAPLLVDHWPPPGCGCLGAGARHR